jgi:NAD(P)-dependent dehydrogenase (short-subunit alcohol dehydrogenase family)
VLISGCSSGIGHATALALAGAGWTVYATARRPESIADLAAAGCRTLALDVTDEASMRAAVDAVEQSEGAVGVLINNAGYSQSGAIETVPIDAVRRQFETNVFGLVRLTQLVLPKMRAQRWGKIINLGSMGGRLSFPGGGHYHATKHAVEALSDAMRFELRGFGIDVILLEPGLITTEFGEAATASMADTTIAGEDPYATFNTTVGAVTKGAYEGPMRLLGGGPERVARTIERALKRRSPPARITITPSAKLTIAMRRLLPDRAWDAAMRQQFPQPR